MDDPGGITSFKTPLELQAAVADTTFVCLQSIREDYYICSDEIQPIHFIQRH